jgi:endonuclease G
MAAASPIGPLAWNECASEHFAGGSEAINALNKLLKSDLQERCEAEVSGGCTGTKSQLVDALIARGKDSVVGPQLPKEGIRICHSGLAVGYDVSRRNPAWVAYRLRQEEQRKCDNDRKKFVTDPFLANEPGVVQTLDDDYTNTEYDRGHLAPSLAMSFKRKALLSEKTGKFGPWESCYFCTNIAPQAASTNRNAWQSFENAIHKYAALTTHAATHDVFLITGLGYWNREKPLLVDKLVVPSFYWTVACDMKAGSSFAIIADNDAYFDDAYHGWPPSVFKLYSAAQVERYFGLKLGLPQECSPAKAKLFIGDVKWPPESKKVPEPLLMEIHSPDQLHIAYGETLALHFRLPLDSDLPDGGGVLKLKAPGPNPEMASTGKEAQFTFSCAPLSVSDSPQLPPGWSCDDSIDGELSLKWNQGPIKGGAFLLDVRVTMPLYRPARGNWTASLSHGQQTLSRLEGLPFELVIRSDGLPGGSHSRFWYFSAGAIIVIILALLLGVLFAFPFGMCYARRKARQLQLPISSAETQLEHVSSHPAQWHSKPMLPASPKQSGRNTRDTRASRGPSQSTPAPMRNLW